MGVPDSPKSWSITVEGEPRPVEGWSHIVARQPGHMGHVQGGPTIHHLCESAPSRALELGQLVFGGGRQVYRAQVFPPDAPWHCELLCGAGISKSIVIRPTIPQDLVESRFECRFDFGASLHVHYIPTDPLARENGEFRSEEWMIEGDCEVQGYLTCSLAQWLEIDPALLSGISSLPVPGTAPDRPAPSADLPTPADSLLPEADRPHSATAPPPEAHSPPTAPSQGTLLLLAPALCALLAAASLWWRRGRR